MKKITISIVSTALMIFGALYLSGQKNLFEKQDIRKNVERIHEEFGDGMFRAFYAMNELRPYSIIQLESTIDLYSNSWISPVELAGRLTAEEKEQLIEAIVEYLAAFDYDERVEIYRKLNLFCVSDKEMELVEYSLGDKKMIFRALKNSDITKEYFTQFSDRSYLGVDDLSSGQSEKAYYEALNKIATMDDAERFAYLSEFYKNMSQLAGKH